MELEEFLSTLDGVRHRPTGIDALCPAHADHDPSLSVSAGAEGGIVLYCHRGCPTENVVAALGLSLADLSPKPHVVATYPYTDAQGRLLYQVQRWTPKDFRCVPGLPMPRDRVLYNMVAIAWARGNDHSVFVCEGEKDCDGLARFHLVATCNPGGAGVGKWLPQYSQALAGLDVVVVCDNDEPGREHGREIARQLKGHARSVRLTRSRVGKDLSDAIDAGWPVAEALEPLPEFDEIGCYTASSIVEKPVRWAWPDYFAFGKLGLISGDPGDGKSLLTIDLAARWSSGAPMPDTTNGSGPFPVIMISAEDDADDTLKPRLIAAGADLEKVHLVVHGVTPDVPFSFAELDTIADLVRRLGARAVIFDPLMAFLPDAVDSKSDHSVRRALQPLKNLASRTGAAVVLVRHLNKASEQKALYRGGGSIAFTGAVRTEFVVIRAEDGVGRLLCPIKNNLAPLAPTLGYRIDAAHGRPFVAWTGPVEISAQTAMDRADKHTEPGDVDEVDSQRYARRLEREFLLAFLADGPHSWAEIMAVAREQSFSEASMRRARADLHLDKIYGERGVADTRWTLPGPARPTAPSPVDTTSSFSTPVDDDDEERRDAELDALPLECAICRTDTGVFRFGKPFWVVRCSAHNPRSYGGEVAR